MPPDADRVWRSKVFPSLWLAGQALLEGRLKDVLGTLEEGLRSPEHLAFVAQLAAQKK